MKSPETLSPPDAQADAQVDAQTLTESVAESVDEAAEAHCRLKQPLAGAPEDRIVWLSPEVRPRALPGDDEPLAQDIEL